MDRRTYLRQTLKALAGATLLPSLGLASTRLAAAPLRKTIPLTGETISPIGMGTWLTFNVPTGGPVFRQRVEVLRQFFAAGGGMIDSSPMYGNAQAVIGAGLAELDEASREALFSATKVWTVDAAQGREQFEEAFRLWGSQRLDLQQVHNLVNWKSHLRLLRGAKEQGRIRYLGVTTSHGRRHEELRRILKTEPLDFVQLTYNVARPETEDLIRLAADQGIAVIANRPLGGGRLIDRVQREPLPEWAAEAGLRDWPDFLLRWIVSHPGVTCAIPATSQVQHMAENMRAGAAPVLDPKLRERMRRYIATIV